MTTVLISLIGGVFTYSLLGYVLVPQRITIPLGIIMFLLIFGLTRYYSQSTSNQNNHNSSSKSNGFTKNTGSYENEGKQTSRLPSSQTIILFVVIYAVALLVCISSKPDLSIFISWKEIGSVSIVQLGASIMLAFFIPGYALILILAKSSRLNPLLKVILAYLFSMLITGLTTYILGTSFYASASQIKSSLITLYVAILIAMVVSYYPFNRNKVNVVSISFNFLHKHNILQYVTRQSKKFKIIKEGASELLIFASLFALLIVSTYYLYGGITLGDQWFHQGRAVFFMSGSFRQFALSGLDSADPPFQSALISGLTTLSGTPLVNTYASIAFLNIIPLFSFYYFFSRWVPPNMQRAKILASSLFTICSGFGWIYLVGLVSTTNPLISEQSAIETIFSIKSYILMPSNFIIASHPDFSTSLIYIAIPAGLLLLGLARQILENKLPYCIAVTIISILGILSHDEYYFFIIVASILPIIFRIREANYMYLSLLVALSAVYLINTVSPLNYYTYNEVFGFPLLFLNIFFVGITWFVYFIVQKASKITTPILSRLRLMFSFFLTTPIRSLVKSNSRAPIIMRLLTISIIAIVYVSTFIILAPLSLKDVNDEALRGTVSWYQYPMKLGVAGLLGLTFVLSYVFKRFEKEIFVFGIIILIALLISPFYDQHRFSKYVMLGMIAFASLLIYKILDFRFKYKPIVNGILIMIIITTGSLSTLLFVGYNSLAFENHDYAHDLGRRNFPTESEFHLLEVLQPNAGNSSSRYNVISTPDEYNFYKGTLLTKLSTFSGIPTGKLLQGRFVLNMTTLDAFYRLLDYTNARFIVIPKDSIKQEQMKLSEPVRFALDVFRHYYEDDKYVVLEVPPLTSPISSLGIDTDVALVYKEKDDSLSESPYVRKTLLKYNNETFNSEINQVEKENNWQAKSNQTQNVILCGQKRNQGSSIWSKGLDEIAGTGINYAEVGFRITDVYNSSAWSDAGLRWKQGDKEYYASLSKNGLEFYQITVGDNDVNGKYDKKLLYQNTEVQKKEGIWYRLKLESLQNSINVYVDGLLKMKVPSVLSGNTKHIAPAIMSVGISCFNNAVDFTPIKVGTVSESIQGSPVDGAKNNYNYNYDEYYYPLSILALSQSKYDTFIDTDLSALSKKLIVLSYDPVNWNDDRFNKYLEFVNEGGTLVVINSDGNLKGRFSPLFSLKSNENASKIKFTNIVGSKNEGDVLNISGMVKNLQIDPSSNASIIASYVNNAESAKNNTNYTVAPFALEKLYPNGGKIILLNAGGYFDAISKSKGTFASLANISGILGLHMSKEPDSFINNSPTQQFVGSMDTTGNLTLRSTSLLIANDTNDDDVKGYNSSNSFGYNINAQSISIYEDKKLKRTFSNVSIKSLELIGDYKVAVNSGEDLEIPYVKSQHNYIGVSMPSGFNMTIELSSKSLTSAVIVMQDQNNQTSIDTIKIKGGSTVQFHNIQTTLVGQDSGSGSRSTFTPILLKNPEVEVNGSTRFTMLRFTWHFLENVKFDLQGLNTKLNFVDDYSEPYGNGTKIKYITFMNSTTNLR